MSGEVELAQLVAKVVPEVIEQCWSFPCCVSRLNLWERGHPTSSSIGLPSEVEPAQPGTKPTLELARPGAAEVEPAQLEAKAASGTLGIGLSGAAESAQLVAKSVARDAFEHLSQARGPRVVQEVGVIK